jgi:YD repeat-containing protein
MGCHPRGRHQPALTYDTVNRLKSVTQGNQTTTFTYDADGQRVKRDTLTDTIVYVGSHYEVLIEEQDIPEDLDGNCVVNVVDIMLVVARWGMTEADPGWDSRYDFNGSKVIDVQDIMLVAVHWRETCEELTETVKYYSLGGQRVAMRKEPTGQADTLYYLFSDHLGSTSVSYRATDGITTTQRYYPWGTIRPGPSNVLPTDYTFTGQFVL